MAEILKTRPKFLDSIPASFILTDVHTRILYANQQAELFFGFPQRELEGQRLRVLFLEEDLLYFLPNIVFLTCYKNGFEGEVLLKQKDGAKIFVYLSTASFREGGDLFLTFSFQEIQRLKNLERERLEMERWASLGKMTEGIAHQFRNPIASIGGYARRLSRSLNSSAKGQAYLKPILRETQRLENILQRVEEYVRVPRPLFRRARIQDVVEKVLPKFAEPARSRQASFRLDTRGLEGDGQVFIDPEMIHSAISHLLDNSLQAIDPKAKAGPRRVVEISAADDGDTVALSVADRGEGISKKTLRSIFDPFFSTRTDRVGLGLTFVRRVMEEHRGRIRVESRLNKGTTVTLDFPKDRRRRVRRELISPEEMGGKEE